MRAKLRVMSTGYVVLTYETDYFGELQTVERTFCCGGNFVKEKRDGQWKSVCVNLGTTGETLLCRDTSMLVDIIRRHYRGMRREQKRELEKV